MNGSRKSFKKILQYIFPFPDELRQLIRRQIKQKELLECELEKEKDKLQTIRLDIITLTSNVMTQNELRALCDEITRLRTVCGTISDEIDVVTARKLQINF